MSDFHHIPVLLNEVLHWLKPEPGQTFVDATVGGAGHARAIAEQLGPDGHIIGIDQDPDAIRAASENLGNLDCQVTLRHGNFRQLSAILGELGGEAPFVHGLLADIGVSSHQFDTAERGFAFQEEGPLDMRMSQEGPDALDLIRSTELNDLTRLLKEGGDVRRAYHLARAMKEDVENGTLKTTTDLKGMCERIVGSPRGGKIHPATTVFQALRIAVNDELGALQSLLDDAVQYIVPGGRLAVISFHSGEDRMVKKAFKKLSGHGALPPGLPVTADQIPSAGTILTRKPITASEEELASNPRARSARLRVFEVSGASG